MHSSLLVHQGGDNEFAHNQPDFLQHEDGCYIVVGDLELFFEGVDDKRDNQVLRVESEYGQDSVREEQDELDVTLE